MKACELVLITNVISKGSEEPGIFVRGGGGGGGSRPDSQKTVWTMFVLVLNLFYSLQRGSNGFITEGVQHFPGGGPTSSRGWGGVQRNPDNL